MIFLHLVHSINLVFCTLFKHSILNSVFPLPKAFIMSPCLLVSRALIHQNGNNLKIYLQLRWMVVVSGCSWDDHHLFEHVNYSIIQTYLFPIYNVLYVTLRCSPYWQLQWKRDPPLPRLAHNHHIPNLVSSHKYLQNKGKAKVGSDKHSTPFRNAI